MANTASQEPVSRNTRRIAPEPGTYNDIIEIRPKRQLRIRRLNPKNRDDKFEREMQVYLQYRENGVFTSSMLPSTSHSQRTVTAQSSRIQTASSLNNVDHKSEQIETIQTSSNVNNSTKENNVSETVQKPEQNTTTGWFSSDLLQRHNAKDSNKQTGTPVFSPSRQSIQSHGVQSASGIQVSLTRPTSEVVPMNRIKENREETEGLPNKTMNSTNQKTDPHSISAKSPRKTKDHRPVSAKAVKHGAKSTASSDISDTFEAVKDFESPKCSHLTSSFKDVTLFFIHGVGGCAEVWNAQLDYFSSLGMEVIAPDLIGHGFSACPDNQRAYHFNEILADLEAIFDRFCKKLNIVIGHSYGCAFAAILGRRRARRVTKLVLISGGAPIPLAPQPGVFSLPICLLSCIRPCLFNRFERGAFHNTKTNTVARELAFDVPVYVLSYMMQGQDWLDGDELYHQWLTMPTLLLHGEHDKFVSLQEELEMEKAIYTSQLQVVEHASHMLMMEAPAEVNQYLYNFFFRETPAETNPAILMSPRAKSSKTRTSKALA